LDPNNENVERVRAVLSHELFAFGKTHVTAWTALVLIFSFTILWFATKLIEKTLAKSNFLDVFGETIKRRLILFARLSIWVVGAIWIIDLANINITAAQIFGYLDSLLNTPFIHLGKTQITLWSVIYVASLWLILIITTNRLQKWCSARLLSRSGIEFGTNNAISVIAKYVVVSIGFIVILQSAGIDLSALTVIAGAMGLGLSFGLQNITQNLVSGLIVLIESPIKVGDRIEVSGITGDVKKIALRATTICTNDNIEIIVPNSEFISGNVINWSHSSRDVRVSLPIGVAYNSDPELVRTILLKVASENNGVLKEPAASVIFKDFGDSSLNFVLRVFTQAFISAPAVLQSDLNFAIFKEFKANSIEVPFPQRDLHIRSMELKNLVDAVNISQADKTEATAAAGAG
jgi:small-conductance mechanosensitive channel